MSSDCFLVVFFLCLRSLFDLHLEGVEELLSVFSLLSEEREVPVCLGNVLENSPVVGEENHFEVLRGVYEITRRPFYFPKKQHPFGGDFPNQQCPHSLVGGNSRLVHVPNSEHTNFGSVLGFPLNLGKLFLFPQNPHFIDVSGQWIAIEQSVQERVLCEGFFLCF